jgi:hypothetical protein
MRLLPIYPVMDGMKTCTKCNQSKLVGEFNRGEISKGRNAISVLGVEVVKKKDTSLKSME